MTIAENGNPGGTFEFNSTTAIVLQVGWFLGSSLLRITNETEVPPHDACRTQSDPQLTVREEERKTSPVMSLD